MIEFAIVLAVLRLSVEWLVQTPSRGRESGLKGGAGSVLDTEIGMVGAGDNQALPDGCGDISGGIGDVTGGLGDALGGIGSFFG
ncbi:MAG: hypothetical protein NVS2B16_32250 [Chloroflexota bacterium]